MNDEQFQSTLDNAREAVAQNDFGGAISMLEPLCRERPDMPAEALLAECRYRFHLGMDMADAEPPADPWPNPPNNIFADGAGVPEVAADALDPAILAAAIKNHGALLVRGLLSEERAASLVEGIDHTLDACYAWKGGSGKTSWYSRMPLAPGGKLADPASRNFMEADGSVWAADSPRMLRELLTHYDDAGIIRLLTDYLGERPVMSVGKTTLRRVSADIKHSDWHQDGAFMGTDIRSVNVWVSLSECGRDASGLDMVPRRLEYIAPTGTEGACFYWTVAPQIVDELANEVGGIVTPRFGPGDAMIFDHYFLHRTGIPEGIARERYAIESWFFSPSAYPADEEALQI